MESPGAQAFFGSGSPTACEDCLRKQDPSDLISIKACTKYHTEYNQPGSDCCWKRVCRKGCSWECGACHMVNRVICADTDEHYYEAVRCYQCHELTSVSTCYYGSVRKACKRYGGNCCGANDGEPIPDTIVADGSISN